MHTSTQLKNNLRFNLALALTLCHCMVSCVSTGTGKQFKNGVVTPDLEAKALKETGLSGSIIGGIGGAVAGFGLGMLIVTLDGLAGPNGRQLSDQQRGQLVTTTTIGGAAAGGIFGYKKGQQKGRQLVASAKQRDQLKGLVNGARDYNARLAEKNNELKIQFAAAKAAKDKKQLAALRKNAEGNRNEAAKVLSLRQGAIAKTDPKYRSGYEGTVPKLAQEKAKLDSIIRDIAATESVISL